MIDELKYAGLTGNEAKIYLELLKTGSISANALSKKLSMDRTLTYQILNNLLDKGLTTYIIKDHKKFFEPTPPESLLKSIKEKESHILQIIPQLNNIQKEKNETFSVNVYEGKEGLKSYFTDIIKSKDLCVFGATGKSFELLKFYIPHVIQIAEKSKIKARLISNQHFSVLKNFKIKILKGVSSTATTTIYGNKVGIHVVAEKPIVTIIESKEIADTYRKHFELLWKIAE